MRTRKRTRRSREAVVTNGILRPEMAFVNMSVARAGRPLRGKQGYSRPYMGFF